MILGWVLASSLCAVPRRGLATNRAIEHARAFIDGRCRDMLAWADGVHDTLPRLQHDIDAIQ